MNKNFLFFILLFLFLSCKASPVVSSSEPAGKKTLGDFPSAFIGEYTFSKIENPNQAVSQYTYRGSMKIEKNNYIIDMESKDNTSPTNQYKKFWMSIDFQNDYLTPHPVEIIKEEMKNRVYSIDLYNTFVKASAGQKLFSFDKSNNLIYSYIS